MRSTVSPALILAVASTVAPAAHGASVRPDEWCADFFRRARSGEVKTEGAYAGRVLVVDPAKSFGLPAGLDDLQKDFARASYLRLVPKAQATVVKAVNREVKAWDPIRLLRATHADLLVKAEAGRAWTVTVVEGDRDTKTLGKVKLETLDAASLSQALRRLLGYDAVVLEQSGTRLLARTPDIRGSKVRLQAVVVKDSEQSFALGTDAKGGGLLELKATGSDCSTFGLLVQDGDAPIAFGTKVILQELPGRD